MTSIRANNFSDFQNLTGPSGPPTFQAYVEAWIPVIVQDGECCHCINYIFLLVVSFDLVLTTR